MKPKIIIVDDEKDFLTLLKDNARLSGQNRFLDIRTFTDPLQALDHFRFYGADMVVTDVRMEGMDGMKLFRSLLNMDSKLPVIIMSAYASVEKAVEAVRMGAHFYFEKPITNPEAFWARIREAALKKKSSADAEDMRWTHDLEKLIIGQSAWRRETIERIRKVVNTKAPILLCGEPGTGKEFLARLIHRMGGQSDGQFIAVDCREYPSGLFERVVFGVAEQGPTGVTVVPGFIDQAEGGTLYLEEVADMPVDVQGKVCRALQQGTFCRIGETIQRPFNVRFIASTTQETGRLVEEGRFRSDLFYQLSVVSFSIPPLRERPDDALPLALFFLARYQKELGKKIDGISFDAMSAIYLNRWNGNIEELEKTIESAVIQCNGIDIMLHDLNFVRTDESKKTVSVTTMKDAARMVILTALQKTEGRKKQAAQLLGIHRNTLNNKMKELGIDEDAWSLERPVHGKDQN